MLSRCRRKKVIPKSQRTNTAAARPVHGRKLPFCTCRAFARALVCGGRFAGLRGLPLAALLACTPSQAQSSAVHHIVSPSQPLHFAVLDAACQPLPLSLCASRGSRPLQSLLRSTGSLHASLQGRLVSLRREMGGAAPAPAPSGDLNLERPLPPSLRSIFWVCNL